MIFDFFWFAMGHLVGLSPPKKKTKTKNCPMEDELVH
jgi:hypothetical protein